MADDRLSMLDQVTSPLWPFKSLTRRVNKPVVLFLRWDLMFFVLFSLAMPCNTFWYLLRFAINVRCLAASSTPKIFACSDECMPCALSCASKIDASCLSSSANLMDSLPDAMASLKHLSNLLITYTL